jgi:hypothetical protein
MYVCKWFSLKIMRGKIVLFLVFYKIKWSEWFSCEKHMMMIAWVVNNTCQSLRLFLAHHEKRLKAFRFVCGMMEKY